MDIATNIDSHQLIEDMVKEMKTSELITFISNLVDDKRWYEGDFPEAVIKRLEEDK